jgi:hypothetical protein
MASLDEESSLPQSDSDNYPNGHSSSSSHFTLDIDPALRGDTNGTTTTNSNNKMDGRKTDNEASRAHIGRKFLSIFSTDKRARDRVPSNKAPLNMQRLGKAELGELTLFLLLHSVKR